MIDFDTTILAASQAAFGEQVTYLPGGGGTLTISGIWTDRFEETKFEDNIEVTTTRPVLNVRLTDLPALPVQGELLRIRGRLYVIAEPPEPDSIGDVRLYLRLANDAQAAITPTLPVPTEP